MSSSDSDSEHETPISSVDANDDQVIKDIRAGNISCIAAIKGWTTRRRILEEAFRRDILTITRIGPEFLSNPLVVEAAVLHLEDALKYADPPLRSSLKIATIACLNHHQALQYVTEPLASDQKFVLRIIQHNPRAFEFAPIKYRDDRQIVTSAVCGDGRMLKFASDRMKRSVQIATCALMQDSRAICYVDKSLYKNFKFMEIACGREIEFVRYADDKLHSRLLAAFPLVLPRGSEMCRTNCDDLRIVRGTVRYSPLKLKDAGPAARDDMATVFLAIRKSQNAWKYASDRLKENLAVAISAYTMYSEMSEKLKSFVPLAKINSNAKYPKRLCAHFDLMNARLKYSPRSVLAVTGAFREFVRDIVDKKPSAVDAARSYGIYERISATLGEFQWPSTNCVVRKRDTDMVPWGSYITGDDTPKGTKPTGFQYLYVGYDKGFVCSSCTRTIPDGYYVPKCMRCNFIECGSCFHGRFGLREYVTCPACSALW